LGIADCGMLIADYGFESRISNSEFLSSPSKRSNCPLLIDQDFKPAAIQISDQSAIRIQQSAFGSLGNC